MTLELKERYAKYFTGDRKAGTIYRSVRLSLNAVKTHFGTEIARKLLRDKKFARGNTHWFELELLSGEKTAEAFQEYKAELARIDQQSHEDTEKARIKLRKCLADA